MSKKLPEEMSKGELLVELLYKGEANVAKTTAMENMKARVELLEQALREVRGAAKSLATAAPEMQPLHIKIIEAAVEMALPEEDEPGI